MDELSGDQEFPLPSSSPVSSGEETGTAPNQTGRERDEQAQANLGASAAALPSDSTAGTGPIPPRAESGSTTDPSLGHEADDDEADDDDIPYDENVQPLEEILEDENAEVDLRWYILKVQSNRENSICEGLQRRVRVAGLDRFFGDILVPTEDVAEFKNGKRYVVKRKLYPGYIVLQMALNDDTWFLVRETPGIGDFAGSAGKPTPMLTQEIERIIKSSAPKKPGDEPIKTAIPFKQGERVRIKEGTFENFEGEVENIDEANGRVTVMINIFGRSTPVELEHWQVGAI